MNERFNSYTSNREAILEDIFNDYYSLKRVDFSAQKEIVENKIYDRGLNNEVIWHSPNHDVCFIKGLKVYNRNALFHLIKKDLLDEQYAIKNVNAKFCFIDLEYFSSMNIPDQFNILGGDYYIQLVALKIDSLIKTSYFADSIEFGRYGGDEFLLFFKDGIEEDSVLDFLQQVEAAIHEEVGFYKKNNHIVQSNITLKGDMDVISIPTDPLGKAIFELYLNRNLLLNSEEIEKAIYDFEFGDNEGIYTNSLHEKNPRYTDQRLEEYKINHPFYDRYFTLIEELSTLNNSPIYKQKLLNYFDNLYQDPLFNFEVLNFSDFDELVSQQPLSHLYIFDLKFVKEFNDKFSLIRGDQVIQKFVETISNLFHDEDKDVINIGRRGGTLKLSIPDFSQLRIESVNNLQRFRRNPCVELHNDINITIPIGMHKQKLNTATKKIYNYNIQRQRYHKNLHIINSLYSKALVSSEEQLYLGFAQFITQHPEVLDIISWDFELLKNSHGYSTVSSKEFTYIDLLSRFLRSSKPLQGKSIDDRYLVRMEKLIKAADSSNIGSELQQKILNLHSRYLDNI